jgi:DinB family protein
LDKPRDKAEMLHWLVTGRQEWEALLAQGDPARMTEPGVEGDWSVRDILAHVVWYEREILQLLQNHAQLPGPSDAIWDLPTDERNATLAALLRDRPLAEVLAESQALGPQLVAAVAALSGADLTDASGFLGMPADWEPWLIIAGNTYGHYPDHIPAIRAWLAGAAPATA